MRTGLSGNAPPTSATPDICPAISEAAFGMTIGEDTASEAEESGNGLTPRGVPGGCGSVNA